MDTYQAEELHLFRNGRTYGGEEAKVDHSGKGYEHLWGGKLAAWVWETTWARGLRGTQELSAMDPAPLLRTDPGRRFGI